MLYVIIASDHDDTLTLRQQYRPAHLARLHKLQEQGRLVVAGANPVIDAQDANFGCTGSVIIAEFANLDDAQNWVNDDPFVKEGVYKNIIVKPFMKVLP